MSSSASATSKRNSILPPISQGPKPPTSLAPNVTIADSAVLTGSNPIIIGAESVILPRSRLESLGGRLTVGRRCIIHERTTIGAIGVEGRVTECAVTLGDYVTVEAAASIEAGDTFVGDGTVVGIGSKIGRGAVVGKFCSLSPLSAVAPGEVVPELTVIYANGLRRADKRDIELRHKVQARQIDVLRKLIPSNPAKFQ